MNLFENDIYYDREQYDKLSYEDQKALFLKIRAWVPQVDEKIRYNHELYNKTIIKKIEQICAYACSGHIPSQDYMGYIYKRGFSDFFPVNYKRSLEWDIIAARNCSKVAPEKMKAFMSPAIDMIALSPRWRQIIVYNDLNTENYFWFLSQYICDLLYDELVLDPSEMSKKPLLEEDSNIRKTRVFLDRFRDRCVTKAIDKLVEKLPEDMPSYDSDEEEDTFKTENKPIDSDLLSSQDEDVFTDIDIDDIE